MTTIWQLLVAFTRANLLGFGGGPSVIPLIRNETVSNFGWLTDAEFADLVAIGNTLPGPIATKIAAQVGYRAGGPLGALAGLLGTVLPTALLMLLLGAVLTKYRDSGFVTGMIKGAKPVVWALFLMLVFDFFSFVRPDQAGWIPTLLAAAAFVAGHYFQVNQGLLIGAGLLIGSLLLR